MVLGKDAFDPDAIFMDDIVDDEVLPNPTLAVDGLNDFGELKNGTLDLRPDDVAANEAIPSCDVLPEVAYDPEQLEVDGWESSFWTKLRRLFGG